MSEDTEFNNAALQKLIKSFGDDVPRVKVGIMGDHNSRKAGEQTNASIGLDHEFGKDGQQQRSFLRVPIQDNLQKYLDDSGAFDEAALKQIVQDGSLIRWMLAVSVCAETIVKDAFATGGFGKWAPHAPGYQNNTGQILVDTQQLRDSITSEVE